MSNLLTQFVTLPLLPVRFGVDLMQRTLEGLLARGGRGGPESSRNTVGARSLAPTPGGGATPVAGWEPGRATGFAGPLDRPPRATGGPPGALGRPTTKEEREMSCNICGSDYCSCGSSSIVCLLVTSDKGLGGRCCVKVVQYVVVSARSGARGSNRIIVDPTTIAFSDDLDESSFTAWVISEHPEEIRRVPPEDRRYLRVAYQVFARFAEEEPNYCQEQVAALWDIAHKLPPPPEEKGGGRGAGGAKKE